MPAKLFCVVMIFIFSIYNLQGGSFLFGDNKEDTQKVERRVDSLESEVNSLKVEVDSLIIQMDRIVAIFKEIRRLEGYDGKVGDEDVNSKAFSNVRSVQSQLNELNRRVKALESDTGTTHSETLVQQNRSEGETDSIKTDQKEENKNIEIRTKYQQAKLLYNRGNYEDAILGFREISKLDSVSTLADNAQFWIGVCYNSMKQYDKAIVEFVEVLNYEDSNKKDDALYNMGRSLVAAGDKSRARSIFQRLIDEYPDSEFVNLAIKQMKEL
ncbi:MAG: tetratricopeptide repeat protein [Candidatus Marinimicrobia bacterium]|nr:tetratricopeptide repeat protein [Candidatus Neomarinimicrobiota bacterium]